MNHNDVANDLATHLRGNTDHMVWTDMQLGPSGSPRPDVYLMSKSYSNWRATSYEVKVSASDLLRDLTSGKWQSYLRFSHGVIFALPAELAKSHGDRIPTQCGIIIRGENGWRAKRRAISSHLQTIPHTAWIKLLIDGVDRARCTTRPRAAADRWQQEVVERKKFGEDTARLIAKARSAPRELEEEVRRHTVSMENIRERNRAVEDAERQRLEHAELEAGGLLREICEALEASPLDSIHKLREIRDLLTPGRYNLLTSVSRDLGRALAAVYFARRMLMPDKALADPARRQEITNDES